MSEFLNERDGLGLNEGKKLSLDIAKRLCYILETKGRKLDDREIAISKNNVTPKKNR